MNNLTKLVAIMKLALSIAFFLVAIAFPSNFALADTDSSTSNSLQQAAQKVIEDDGAKDQFGQSENGEQLLDKAKTEASKKLTKLADKKDSEDLPESEKLFLKNLKPE